MIGLGPAVVLVIVFFSFRGVLLVVGGDRLIRRGPERW